MEWLTVGSALGVSEEPVVWVGDEGELNCVGLPANGAYMMEWLTVGGASGGSEEPVVLEYSECRGWGERDCGTGAGELAAV